MRRALSTRAQEREGAVLAVRRAPSAFFSPDGNGSPLLLGGASAIGALGGLERARSEERSQQLEVGRQGDAERALIEQAAGEGRYLLE